MSDGKSFTITAGNYHQLGANYDGEGVNFALFSAHAQRVELCLYAPDGKQEIARLDLPEYTHEIWHGYVPGLKPGALYGFRVHGLMTRKMVTVLTRINCWLTRMPANWLAMWSGMNRTSPTICYMKTKI
jgi:pullulanase/glycogen debranching enzyme